MYDRKRIACMRGVQGSLACTCLHSLSSTNTVLHQNVCSAQASSTHQRTSVHTACSCVRKLSRAQEILYNEFLIYTGEILTVCAAVAQLWLGGGGSVRVLQVAERAGATDHQHAKTSV
jgi:hypothetical protein